MGEPVEAAAKPGRRRTWVSFLVAIIGGAGLLWLASQRLDLWPERITPTRTDMFVLGCVLYLPYVYARSVRLRYLLDPFVREAVPAGPGRLDGRLLHGSGLFSFFVVLLMPLRLGELSRPLILARAGAPGVDMPRAMAVTVVERAMDGVFVTASLLLGLAFISVESEDPQVSERLEFVRQVGGVSALLFVGVLVVFGLIARAKKGPARLVRRVLGEGGVAVKVAEFVDKAASATTPLWAPRQGLPFVAWTIAYVVLAVLQLWALLLAAGVDAGWAEAALTLGVLGLSIQLPGGPAQAGSFQVGLMLALSVFAGPGVIDAEGSTFAVLMYGVTVAGAILGFFLGLILLRSRKSDVSSDR